MLVVIVQTLNTTQEGDWKFLAMVTGIDSATSIHACNWCKCPALERYDCIQKWSISDKRKVLEQ